MAKRQNLAAQITAQCKAARLAAPILATALTETKNRALELMAIGLRTHEPEILRANAKDMSAGRRKNLSAAMLDRLLLTPARLEDMAKSLREVAALPDPVGQEVGAWERPNGLHVKKVRIPIGVIAMIYEARPNVTVEAASLCLKSGNAGLLRGGSEAFHSNRALAKVLAASLAAASLPPASIQVLRTAEREAVNELLKMDAYIDLVIPRGGESLIRSVVKRARMPVIKHYKGVCHLFVDESADAKMAEEILLNGKVQRPGVCNAIETLLVHRALKTTLLPALVAALQEKGVEVRGTPEVAKLCKDVKRAAERDFGYEFLDLIIAVKLVDDIDEAIAHIRKYGSAHTESIITEDPRQAERFLNEVHSSCVMSNASTRFADGGELGMGAEIGISTTKIHAFGPMGLEDLTIPHYTVRGRGQVRVMQR